MDLVSYVPHHPLPGETLTSNGFNTSPGGKGANQAVACAKLSRTSQLTEPLADVAMIGAVGQDAYGPADVSGVSIPQGLKTGVAVIIVDEPSGQNRIVVSPEANHSLRPEHFTQLPRPLPDLLIMQLEIPLDTVLQALSAAKSTSVPVLLSAQPESELDHLPGLRLTADLFLQRGVRNVIITLGGRGVYYASKNGRNGLLPAEKTTVVDTTAAGDTFVGSYALAAVRAASEDEFDIEAAVKEANRAAAKTVARKGAQVSIPWKDEL
jgi:ribokinase